ncbi:helix-turn-helix domain-containing protein [Staphylococcus coagulans]|uniref:helix-turn-helix domain-containing protein n=1 Tax=Staphylococcus coagulans TaxID=74706 RepID=UPI0015F98C92|nr:helix-turn-helix transcriptional regulator [Staphylococcus coagulans]MBA8764679.1 helix-turn-helix domain-containing protein [Staphylococcus coagulans]MBT2810135.1 helix-turn-helix transcriptional regulator [Staphylococcus coagulans]MBT2821684.1 helix-turn-helix transcriptional regulator [Staphylococcus coagulans]MBT2830783.1 helix-turn-helix transcriptional regulator [Staphylococcus coagulans]MBT2839989.1 helix-turn-helix transcriptional regulator [Staphylococcus coagulans]
MNLQDYGARLKSKRKDALLTQKMLSKSIGISRSYYSDIENGRVIPSGKILFKINEIIPIFIDVDDVNNRINKKEE